MTQEASDYGREVNEYISSVCRVEEYKTGRWIAYLDPVEDFVRMGAQPPGQSVVYHDGDPTYSAESTVWDVHEGPILDMAKLSERQIYRAAWAARPNFLSATSAREKLETWVRINRPDIVREAGKFARHALAYRRQQSEQTNA